MQLHWASLWCWYDPSNIPLWYDDLNRVWICDLIRVDFYCIIMLKYWCWSSWSECWLSSFYFCFCCYWYLLLLNLNFKWAWLFLLFCSIMFHHMFDDLSSWKFKYLYYKLLLSWLLKYVVLVQCTTHLSINLAI